MKKIICIVFVLLALSTSAFADEITFRDIQWGTNVKDTLSSLGLYDSDEVTNNSNRNVRLEMMIHPDTIEKFGSGRTIEYDRWGDVECGYKGVMFWSPEFIVAGHEISNLELQFLYGISDGAVLTDKNYAEFVSAKYEFNPEDYVAVYEELLDKLIWLYGEPVSEDFISGDSYLTKSKRERYAEWNGDNCTSLLLYVKYDVDKEKKSTNELSLEYAKTDIEKRVKLIADYFTQMERDLKYNSENTSGL